MGKFLVRLTNEFSAISGAARRFRAGLEIPVGGEVEADLDKDQLKELHEDQYVTVHEAKTGKLIVPEGAPDAPAISTEGENARTADETADQNIVEDIKANVQAQADDRAVVEATAEKTAKDATKKA